MWSKRDVAQALLAAILFLIVGLLLFPPVSRPATLRRISPAYWLFRQTHAPRGELVGVDCRVTARPRERCLLVLQSRARFCFWVDLAPSRRAWRVLDVAAIDPAACPVLRMAHRQGLHALSQ